MSEKNTGNELLMWLSTYGLITAERLLERYKIRLSQKDLINTINNPDSFYHQILRVPLKNVFNGIIMQQTRDYQIYVQKLFIDYLVSGETIRSEDSPGGGSREDLEGQRIKLKQMNEDFQENEFAHAKLISISQKSIIEISNNWQNALTKSAKIIHSALAGMKILKEESVIIQTLTSLVIHSSTEPLSLASSKWLLVEEVFGEEMPKELKTLFSKEFTVLKIFVDEIQPTLATYIEQAAEMGIIMRKCRADFHDLIIRVDELIKLLPDYHYDPVQNQENKSSLYFDSDIGR